MKTSLSEKAWKDQRVHILSEPLDAETIRQLNIDDYKMEYINDDTLHVYKFTYTPMSYEAKVFQLIDYKAFPELVAYKNTHEPPGRWTTPYKSIYSRAIDTGDADFALKVIEEISLECDWASGWSDLLSHISKTCVRFMDVNQKYDNDDDDGHKWLAVLKALWHRVGLCKTRVDELTSMLEKKHGVVVKYKADITHDCIQRGC